jgi:sulfur carrier protein
MTITLNGEPHPLGGPTTVADLLADRTREGTAVAVNGSVVPRARHAELALADGDAVEIVTAVQGG